uniref:Capsid protein n=1 Tax=Chicken anemia virus TaxID=12618 RepID=Q0WY98_9VIRU|nr:VP1d2 [Chicken anemia virus]
MARRARRPRGRFYAFRRGRWHHLKRLRRRYKFRHRRRQRYRRRAFRKAFHNPRPAQRGAMQTTCTGRESPRSL